MIDSPAGDCKYLDARLTFRRVNSTGHLEICNEVGQWSVVCGSSQISEENARVVCNQLGFDPNFVLSNSLPQSTLVLNVGRPVTSVISALECTGNELNLTACPQTDVSVEPAPEPCSSLEIQCGGKHISVSHSICSVHLNVQACSPSSFHCMINYSSTKDHFQSAK